MRGLSAVRRWCVASGVLLLIAVGSGMSPLHAESAGAAADSGGVIAGRVTLEGQGAADLQVFAYSKGSETPLPATSLQLDGSYEIGGLEPGTYVVQVSTVTNAGITAWWPGVSTRAAATPIPIVGAERVGGIDVDLIRTGTLSGTITDALGQPIHGAIVQAWGAHPRDQTLGSETTTTDGRFTIRGLTTGSIKLEIISRGNHIAEWWGGSLTRQDAALVEVENSTDVDLGQIALATGSVIRGRLTTTGTGGSIARAYAWAYLQGQRVGTPLKLAEVDGAGEFELAGLPPGDYEIRFTARGDGFSPPLVAEWFPDALWRQNAERITVGTEEIITGVDAELDEVGALYTTRIAGRDRFETAAILSSVFSPGVAVAYIATGRNFPDALAAAAAAAHLGGPLLLVDTTSIPESVGYELERLQPEQIVVVGGTNMVSASVESDLRAYAGSGGVRRDAGSNRFETSRIIAERAFGASYPAGALIATGMNFPDALAGSSLAGFYGMPVILVDGSSPGLDAPTTDLLERLGIGEAIIAGSTASVSAGIESDLRELLTAPPVQRVAGPHRYATAVELSRMTSFAASPNTVFLATGLGFPDALAGAAVAGGAPAPLLLAPGSCVPEGVLDEIDRIEASYVVILGGETTLSRGVEELTSCGW